MMLTEKVSIGELCVVVVGTDGHVYKVTGNSEYYYLKVKDENGQELNMKKEILRRMNFLEYQLWTIACALRVLAFTPNKTVERIRQ